MTTKIKREINDTVYEVIVKENEEGRNVQVHDCEQRKAEGHSYVIVKDKRTVYEPNWFERLLGMEPEGIADRTAHVSEALNEAIARVENRQEEREERHREIKAAVDAAEDVWEG